MRNPMLSPLLSLALASGISSAGAAVPVIPRPVRVEAGQGVFKLEAGTVIAVPRGQTPIAAVGRYLSEALKPATGWTLDVREVDGQAPAGGILLTTAEAPASLGPDGYALNVTAGGVVIRAAGPAGLFHGVQTLRQLLPPAILGSAASRPEGGWTVPGVRIEDVPRYRWRGLMLDCARHYMPVDFIKRFIDLMALHKFNTFHWHLTDDQGWRIEIKKYPRLTEVGSIRKESPMRGNRNQGDGTPYGPFFYTQEQVREVVAYAASRFITVVPEIEMPGHALAALVAYPDLSCTGGPFAVRTRWGVEPDIFCAGNDKTFEFVQDILTEVIDLFPSTFIHIGGDEAPKDRWNKCPKCQARIKAEGLKDAHGLQSYFVRRIDTFLASKGRRLIGWDEILEGGLAPGAAVMSWRGIRGGIAAASEGHDVVMSPTSHCYLDYAQAKGPGEPEAIGGHVPLKTVYGYEPTPAELTPDRRKHVLGVQGNLWAEYLRTPQDVEYFGFPRACALSEVAWSPADAKNYEDFLGRLAVHTQRLDALKVNYRKLSPEPVAAARWKSGDTTETLAVKEWDVSAAVKESGTYEVVFQYTGGTHRLDIAWAELVVDGAAVERDTHDGVTGASHRNNAYKLTLPARPATAKILLRANVRSDGGADSNGEILIRRI